MSGTTHRCLVTNHRIHAPCGVEIEVEGDRVYVVKVVDGTPILAQGNLLILLKYRMPRAQLVICKFAIIV